jgi:hypothetical protein
MVCNGLANHYAKIVETTQRDRGFVKEVTIVDGQQAIVTAAIASSLVAFIATSIIIAKDLA